MADIPDTQMLEYCRMSCNGAFSTVQEGSSASASNPAAPPGHSVKMPREAGVTVSSNPTATGTVAPSQYAMEENTNRFGEDYKDLDLDVPNPVLCAEACTNEPECRAWTYVKPGVQADYAKCWLKDKVPPPSPDENCVSGVSRK